MDASRSIGQTELGMLSRHCLPYCFGILALRISSPVGYFIVIADALASSDLVSSFQHPYGD